MNGQMILVSGATGKQGGAVVRHALQRGFKVRALTRNPNSPAAQSLKTKGVEVVQGDMEDTASLPPALKGAYGVFSVQNFWESGVGFDGEIRQARNLAQVAHDEKVSHFVQSSIARCDNANGIEQIASKWEIEKAVDALHLPRTFLRVVFFMDNLTDPRMGKMMLSALAGALNPNTRLHMISVEDIGWFVAEAFANPATYLGKTLDLAGDSLTVEEIKQVHSSVTGQRPTGFRFPAWLLKLTNAKAARQFQWNNEVGWHFDIHRLREIHPDLLSLEQFMLAQRN